MNYVANPVVVDAYKIVDIHPVPLPTITELDAILNEGKQPVNGLMLNLEDGSIVNATMDMLSRITPEVGDYWVIQSDGYIYLNPKDVFERKYRPQES